MLAYVLALAVGLGSLAIYMAAFVFPEIHRKSDFIWSGLGLFYALVLWVCAGRITGGVLLGELAGVTLLGWSVTQTLQLRRELTPRQQQTELPSPEEVKNTVEEKLSNLSIPQRLSQLSDRLSGTFIGVKDQIQQKLSVLPLRQSKSDSTPLPSTASPSAAGKTAALQSDETNQKVRIVDKRTPATTEQPTTEAPDELVQAFKAPALEDAPSSEEFPETDADLEPALTEEEAIALAVETTLAKDAALESEPVRPHPPDPKLVEAALQDAEEKHEEASPPEIKEN